MGLFDKLKKNADTLTDDDLVRLERRDGISNLLPFVAYDPEERIYRNTDETCGCAWECDGIGYMNTRNHALLTELLRTPLPEDAVFQATLYGTSHIDDKLARSLSGCDKAGTEWALAKQHASVLLQAARAQAPTTVARSLRLFITIKIDAATHTLDELIQLRDSIEEALATAGMNPRPLEPGRLLGCMRILFNDTKGIDAQMLYSYDDEVPMRKQVILSETKVHTHAPDFISGGRAFHCITPHYAPAALVPLQASELIGSTFSTVPGLAQIESDFIYSVNIIHKDLRTKNEIAAARKKAKADAAAGEPVAAKMLANLSFWVIDGEPQRLERSIKVAKQLWQSIGFLPQEELRMLPVSLLSALPFGLYHIGDTVEQYGRFHWRDASYCAALLPVQFASQPQGVTTAPHFPVIHSKGEISLTDCSGTASAICGSYHERVPVIWLEAVKLTLAGGELTAIGDNAFMDRLCAILGIGKCHHAPLLDQVQSLCADDRTMASYLIGCHILATDTSCTVAAVEAFVAAAAGSTASTLEELVAAGCAGAQAAGGPDQRSVLDGFKQELTNGAGSWPGRHRAVSTEMESSDANRLVEIFLALAHATAPGKRSVLAIDDPFTFMNGNQVWGGLLQVVLERCAMHGHTLIIGLDAFGELLVEPSLAATVPHFARVLFVGDFDTEAVKQLYSDEASVGLMNLMTDAMIGAGLHIEISRHGINAWRYLGELVPPALMSTDMEVTEKIAALSEGGAGLDQVLARLAEEDRR